MEKRNIKIFEGNIIKWNKVNFDEKEIFYVYVQIMIKKKKIFMFYFDFI